MSAAKHMAWSVATSALLCTVGCYEGSDNDSDSGASDLGAAYGSTSQGEVPDEAAPSTEESGEGTQASPPDLPAAPDPDSVMVEFSIALGTQGNAWNTADGIVTAYVGQTLRLINEDSVPHTLHTFGVPTEHGDPISPGDSMDFLLTEPYDPGAGPPEVWDHEAGEPAYFWLHVLERE